MAFGVHIGFTEGKGINIRGRIQVCQTVVYEAMRSFVRSDGIDYVQQFCIFRETPVVNRNFGGRLARPTSERSVKQVKRISITLTILESFLLPCQQCSGYYIE